MRIETELLASVCMRVREPSLAGEHPAGKRRLAAAAEEIVQRLARGGAEELPVGMGDLAIGLLPGIWQPHLSRQPRAATAYSAAPARRCPGGER